MTVVAAARHVVYGVRACELSTLTEIISLSLVAWKEKLAGESSTAHKKQRPRREPGRMYRALCSLMKFNFISAATTGLYAITSNVFIFRG